jgi:DNA replication protein DnaC
MVVNAKRNLIRQRKIAEWETRIQMLHEKYPRLQEISRLFAEMALELALLELGKGKMGLSREELLQAQEALQAEKKALLRKYKLPPNIYDIWWDCEICQDTGYKGIGEKCSCLLQEELDLRWQASGLSPHQKEQTFANFSLDWSDDPQRLRELLQACVDFAENVSNKKPTENLFLYGPVGTGKTHLCSAIANYCIQAGVGVVYLKSGRLLDLIREYKFELDRDDYEGRNRKLEELYHVELLIIDDLGTENLTDFAREQLLLLIDERINHRLPLVVSTNLSPNEIGVKYLVRISDRLLTSSRILKFTGGSFRQRKMLARVNR